MEPGDTRGIVDHVTFFVILNGASYGHCFSVNDHLQQLEEILNSSLIFLVILRSLMCE